MRQAELTQREHQMVDVVFNTQFNMLTQSVFFGRLTENSASRIVIQDGGRTGVYEGNFTYSVSGEVFGTMRGYTEYRGGSVAWGVSEINFDANTAFRFINAGALQGLFTNALSGPDRIFGSDASDVLFAGAGNDRIMGRAGNDEIHGDSGIDTAVFQGRVSDYTITPTSFGITVRDRIASRDATDLLSTIERAEFADGKLAFDVYGNAGEAYRLYQAAFDRTPDTGGISYWIKQRDAGISLTEIASAFIGSSEFAQRYGGTDDRAFTNLLYQNVLDRLPDAGGADYWMGQLARGLPRAEMLAGFSESSENQQNTAPAISKGILYFDLV